MIENESKKFSVVNILSKSIHFFILLTATSVNLNSQNSCSDCIYYQTFLNEGNKYLEAQNFDKALIEFQAAQVAAKVCKCNSKEPAEFIAKAIKGIQNQKREVEVQKNNLQFALVELRNQRTEILDQKSKLERTLIDLKNQIQARNKAEMTKDSLQIILAKIKFERTQLQDEKEGIDSSLNILKADLNKFLELQLDDFQESIYNMKYDEAFNKLHRAGIININNSTVKEGFFELTFYYNEIGNEFKALNLLESIQPSTINPEINLLIKQANSNPNSKQSIRKVLEIIDSPRYDFLLEKYYPIMIKVKGGEFEMGCDNKGCQEDELPPHLVKLSDFYIAISETTNLHYHLYCKANNISSPTFSNPNIPVSNVSWIDAARYINWLNLQMGKDTVYQFNQYGELINIRHEVVDCYRLPTEAEWEFAAKGGINYDEYIYSGSNKLDEVAWHGLRVNEVGKKRPNSIGLYDMTGNLWEWCQDVYNNKYYSKAPIINPLGPIDKKEKIKLDEEFIQRNNIEEIGTVERENLSELELSLNKTIHSITLKNGSKKRGVVVNLKNENEILFGTQNIILSTPKKEIISKNNLTSFELKNIPRVLRGGAIGQTFNENYGWRNSNRYREKIYRQLPNIGFRIVQAIPEFTN